MNKFAVLLCLLFVCGCEKSKDFGVQAPPPNVKEGPGFCYIRENSRRAAVLPDGAENVRLLGNGWLLFDVVIDGQRKTFLFARHESHYYMSATITQVN